MKDLRRLAAIALAMLAVAGCAVVSRSQPVPAPAGAEAGADRLLMFVDPETGERRAPTEQELADLRTNARSGKALASPQAIALPDGTFMLPAEATLHRVTATRGTDGKVELHCETPEDSSEVEP
jgi:hypothetical protein